MIYQLARDGGIYDRCTRGHVVSGSTKFQFFMLTLISFNAHFRDQREKKNACNSGKEHDSCAVLFFVLEYYVDLEM